jgi:hypothetical protein
MKVNAIVFGATGMVGEGVLLVTLNHPHVESVLSISRRPCGIVHPKLKEIVRKDFYNYTDIEEELKGYNACFFCLGVSSVGMKEEDYKRVTYDLTIATAGTLAGLNAEMTFCYVSGTGTDSSEKGRQMWARVKGRTENSLTKLPFKAVYNFRPGFIKPVEGQKHAFKVAVALGKIYPLLKAVFPKYVCTCKDIGLAMIHASQTGCKKVIVENVDIAILAVKE